MTKLSRRDMYSDNHVAPSCHRTTTTSDVTSGVSNMSTKSSFIESAVKNRPPIYLSMLVWDFTFQADDVLESNTTNHHVYYNIYHFVCSTSVEIYLKED